MFFFSSLISTIESNKYKAQEERQVLLQQISKLEQALAKSKSRGFTIEDLRKFDAAHETKFAVSYNKTSLPYMSDIPPNQQLYRWLKKERENKEREMQRLSNLRVIDFIPPFPLLFVTGLGVVIVRLLNKVVDYVCDKGGEHPVYALIGFFVFICIISAVICWV